ncbi:hypothetical protein [Arthrobacter oryzae]|uniref:Uncharacterized protein n=1 Tax=Arthrobacter oryzae TaxID=409290 RepID=A0A3N0C3W5_9MICC|nr:hypothetical protein [Arthrobacter oryzae]RNL57379.1 hypothetical protein D7003_06295 [Arthrobacter oryzae]
MKLGLMGDPKQIPSIGALQAPLTRAHVADPVTVAPRPEPAPTARNPNGGREEGAGATLGR